MKEVPPPAAADVPEVEAAGVSNEGAPAAAAASEPTPPAETPPPDDLGAPAAGVKRCSHLLAHVHALDCNGFAKPTGTFALSHPSRWHAQRTNLYESLGAGKGHYFDSNRVAAERKRMVRYNVSVAFQQLQPEKGTYDARSGYGGIVGAPQLLSPGLRSKLLGVYHDGAESQALKQQALEELHQSALGEKGWAGQGAGGCFYFSHVEAEDTQQEPVQHKLHDIVTVPFPCDPSGVPYFQLPPRGANVSIVCETVLEESLFEAHAKKGGDAGRRGASSPDKANAPKVAPRDKDDTNPYSYVRHVWQMVGALHPSDTAPKLTEKEAAVLKEEAASVGQPHHHLSAASGLGNAAEAEELVDAKRDAAEYVLETNLRYDLLPVKMPDAPLVQQYVVKLGVPRAHPQRLRYLSLEVPCAEACENARPTFVARCREEKPSAAALAARAAAGSAGGGTASLLSRGQKDAVKRPPIPAVNHILCEACHGIGRPFVLMSKPGVKDEGFAQGFLAARTKQYKAWEKAMMEALKQDSNKSLVILEVGCDRRMDPARAYSEKTFKTLKSGKVTFVRIAPYSLETKKGGQDPPANQVTLEMPVVQAITRIDMLLDRQRKR